MSDAKEPDQVRTYEHVRKIKYGCNPQQKTAAYYNLKGQKCPFEILNGNPGYINLLDAMNAWQLVKELRVATNLPAAASFKHVSPAGCAVAVPLSKTLREVYGVKEGEKLSHSAVAYLRARQADPKSSFGDFAALSDKVDEQTAKFLKREVSDGIIAPDYSPEALAILKTKKGGNYTILKMDPDYTAPEMEYREIFGVGFAQERNHVQLTAEHMQNVVTKNNKLDEGVVRDLLIASICLKYTQSNSVGYAVDGQMIGVGAGQQSRVDCVKLAGGKVDIWYLRQHPKVMGLKFKEGTKRVQKLNARVDYIENDFTEISKGQFEALFDEVPEELTEKEKKEYLSTLSGISLASDAFFPFPDNIDHCSKRGVSYISQPGGSVQDKAVTAQADKYGMAMCMTGVRMFHH